MANSLQGLLAQAQRAEHALLRGATYYELAAELGVDPKTARRLVAQFREMGCVIDEQQANAKGLVRLKMQRATRIFRK